MTWTNLDLIVKGVLISRGYPIHYYMQFLFHAKRCYEELNFDSLKAIKTVSLAPNSYNAITLPCDYLDFTKVGIPNGQFVRPLARRSTLSRLNNFDSSGNKVIHGEAGNTNYNFTNGLFFSGYQNFYNSNGEFTGRMFGLGAGDNANTFTVLPERNEIQLHESLNVNHIILQYISDGTSIDNATMITPYAISSIEAYIIWKMKETNRNYQMGERMEAKRQFDLEHAKLRARIFGLTKDDIFYTVRKNTHGSIKG
jgi:hypothetical protein